MRHHTGHKEHEIVTDNVGDRVHQRAWQVPPAPSRWAGRTCSIRHRRSVQGPASTGQPAPCTPQSSERRGHAAHCDLTGGRDFRPRRDPQEQAGRRRRTQKTHREKTQPTSIRRPVRQVGIRKPSWEGKTRMSRAVGGPSGQSPRLRGEENSLTPRAPFQIHHGSAFPFLLENSSNQPRPKPGYDP